MAVEMSGLEDADPCCMCMPSMTCCVSLVSFEVHPFCVVVRYPKHRHLKPMRVILRRRPSRCCASFISERTTEPQSLKRNLPNSHSPQHQVDPPEYEIDAVVLSVVNISLHKSHTHQMCLFVFGGGGGKSFPCNW